MGYGLVLGILDAFPVLGTGLFLVPAGIFQMLLGDSFQGVGFLVLYGVTAVVRQILEPRLIGNHMGVSPLLVLLSVYWGFFCTVVSVFFWDLCLRFLSTEFQKIL